MFRSRTIFLNVYSVLLFCRSYPVLMIRVRRNQVQLIPVQLVQKNFKNSMLLI